MARVLNILKSNYFYLGIFTRKKIIDLQMQHYSQFKRYELVSLMTKCKNFQISFFVILVNMIQYLLLTNLRNGEL